MTTRQVMDKYPELYRIFWEKEPLNRQGTLFVSEEKPLPEKEASTEGYDSWRAIGERLKAKAKMVS